MFVEISFLVICNEKSNILASLKPLLKILRSICLLVYAVSRSVFFKVSHKQCTAIVLDDFQ